MVMDFLTVVLTAVLDRMLSKRLKTGEEVVLIQEDNLPFKMWQIFQKCTNICHIFMEHF